jgi:hypothetical protein
MGINLEASDKGSFIEEYGQQSRHTQSEGKSKTRLFKTDIANLVLKDTRFNLQERVYIRNIEYTIPGQQAYAFLSKYVFPTTLTNAQRIMVSSCFKEYLNRVSQLRG